MVVCRAADQAVAGANGAYRTPCASAQRDGTNLSNPAVSTPGIRPSYVIAIGQRNQVVAHLVVGVSTINTIPRVLKSRGAAATIAPSGSARVGSAGQTGPAITHYIITVRECDEIPAATHGFIGPKT